MIIFGRNPVLESIRSSFKPKRVILYRNLRDIESIKELLKKHGIPYELSDKHRLEQIAKGEKHQGMVAYLDREPIYPIRENVKDFLNNDRRIIAILDRIQDPRNLGSIIRTASLTGVRNIILTRKSTTPITPTVVKASAGAIFHVKVSVTDNLKFLVGELKEKGVGIFSLERGGKPIEEMDFPYKLSLIIGSEHYGIRKSLMELSDGLVSLSQEDSVNSYNVSIATGIAFYVINFLKNRYRRES